MRFEPEFINSGHSRGADDRLFLQKELGRPGRWVSSKIANKAYPDYWLDAAFPNRQQHLYGHFWSHQESELTSVK